MNESLFEIRSVPIPGLGNHAHVVVSGGVAAVVDVPRVATPVLDAVAETGASVRWIAETHVHNDYLSGALEVRSLVGGDIIGPEGAGYTFAADELPDGATVPVGDVSLRVMSTPGHTPEHVAYIVIAEDRPAAILSGGSLLLGSAGRTDLLGTQMADALGRAQFHSLRRIAALPADVAVLPTHGGGSFCATGPAIAGASSTVGREAASNPFVRARDEEEFLGIRTLDRYPYPAYYSAMAPANRLGPPPAPADLTPPPMSPDTLAAHVVRGAVIDIRDRWSFAAGHVPGSLGISMDESAASYVGAVVPPGTEIALVSPHPLEATEAARRLARIGYEVVGALRGGFAAWEADGRPVATSRTLDAWELVERIDDPGITLLDVRNPWEWDEGIVPGSVTIHLGELRSRLDELPRDRDLWVVCAAGRRSEVALSILEAAGIEAGGVFLGGVAEIREAVKDPSPGRA